MQSMKNLFDFATKELSQDAFLRWTFENWSDPTLSVVGKQLIVEMVNLYDGNHVDQSQINSVKTYGQVQKIDIVVDFKINQDDCILIIEDKTTSSEHSNQLIAYKEHVEKWNKDFENKTHKSRKSFYIFYKTHKIDEDERKRIIDAGWKEFPFKKINEFWSQFKNHQNFLIGQYAEHVTKSWQNSENKALPCNDNIDEWIGYFGNTLKQKIIYPCDIWVNSTYFGYAYFCLRPKGRENDPIPYLEIRSRDCLNKSLIGRILLYGVKISDEQKETYKQRIREKCKYFECENNAQQISSTKKKIKWSSKDDFVHFVNKLIKEYLSIF